MLRDAAPSLPQPASVAAAIAAYDPGHDLVRLRQDAGAQGLVELGSNENAFGPCQQALDLVRECSPLQLLRYPDPHGHELKAALARHLGVAPCDICLGNGSHELLMLLAQAYAGAGDEVLFSEFGFAVYAIAARSVGARAVAASALPATHAQAPRGHDLDAFACALSPHTRLVYLANPNNPTGTAFSREAFAAFLRRVPRHVLVVVDEAYVEYAAQPDRATVLGLRQRFPNLVVTRTFSKIHGLAGLRVGYAIAHPRVIETLDRVRETFNINTLALVAARAALADQAHVEHCRDHSVLQRRALTDALRGLGLSVPESAGNFVLADFGSARRDAAAVETGLLAEGVVVRPMSGYGLPQCLRITVGTAAEQGRLVAAMRTLLA